MLQGVFIRHGARSVEDEEKEEKLARNRAFIGQGTTPCFYKSDGVITTSLHSVQCVW